MSTAKPLAASNAAVGINLASMNYWASDLPLNDQFRKANGWLTSNDSQLDTQESAKLDLDANGWVKSFPAASNTSVSYRYVSALLFQDDGGNRIPGKYIVLYDGKGTMRYRGSATLVEAESTPGRDIVNVTNKSGDAMFVEILATTPGNHIRNIRVIPPGGVCAGAPSTVVASATACPSNDYQSFESLNKTQSFSPMYVNDLRGMRALRFMDWGNTDRSTIKNWAERPTMNSVFWNKIGGVPFEAMFELSNATGADPWINMPTYVTDDFVRQFARLAKQQLVAPKVMFIEYGNEAWNFAPPFGYNGQYYQQQAALKWPGSTLDPYVQRLNWYAYRSVQVCRIIKQEFGDQAGMVNCVMGSQAGNPTISETVLGCSLAKGELGTSCGKAMNSLAIAPYYGYYFADPQFAAKLGAWTTESDGGLSSVFKELTGKDASGYSVPAPLYTSTSGTSQQGAVSEVKAWMVATRAVADSYGLPMIAYEGGQHMTATSAGGAIDKMLLAANRDPRMGSVMTRYFSDWKEAGGQLFVHFNYISRPAQGMYWGVKESQLDNTNPKWLAVKSFKESVPCWWASCSR